MGLSAICSMNRPNPLLNAIRLLKELILTVVVGGWVPVWFDDVTGV